VAVGEIAAAPARDEDLFADAIGMVENEHAPASLACGDCRHEPGCSGAEHQDVACLFVMCGWGWVQGHAGLFRLCSRGIAHAMRST
jgi:hypothetical protein